MFATRSKGHCYEQSKKLPGATNVTLSSFLFVRASACGCTTASPVSTVAVRLPKRSGAKAPGKVSSKLPEQKRKAEERWQKRKEGKPLAMASNLIAKGRNERRKWKRYKEETRKKARKEA